ncbi:MAG: hypothetical protein QOE90_2245 [Thermoplasmata archaeon]|jgi:hypothetical protein|nr:hypothetical protein [Thermoplasmata archaeon]
MTGPAAGPSPPPPPSFEEIVRGTATALVGAIIELVRAVRHEVEAAQASGLAFVGRLLGALGRAGRLALRGMRDAMIALVFAVLGLIILSIFLIAALNKLLGDPWGTGLTALLLILAAVGFGLRSRAAFLGIEAEARELEHPPR